MVAIRISGQVGSVYILVAILEPDAQVLLRALDTYLGTYPRYPGRHSGILYIAILGIKRDLLVPSLP